MQTRRVGWGSWALYLVQVLQFGRQIVPNHLHGFERWLVKIRRLPVHHLYDHDAQRPDVHLRPSTDTSWSGPVNVGCSDDVKKKKKKKSTVAAVRQWVVTSGPYGSLDMSSGAIQYGVPTRDFLLCTSLDTWAQKPKSDSFTWRQTEKKFNK